VAFEVSYEMPPNKFNPDALAANSCEIHTERITDVAPEEAVECWVKGGHGQKRKYALLGTGQCLPASLDQSGAASREVAAPGSLRHHYECRTACDTEDACTAYELMDTGEGFGCKLWTDQVTQVDPCEAGSDCWCWVKQPVAKPASADPVALEADQLVHPVTKPTSADNSPADQGNRGKASPLLSSSSSRLLFLLLAVESGFWAAV
jgi:hypothetical protein